MFQKYTLGPIYKMLDVLLYITATKIKMYLEFWYEHSTSRDQISQGRGRKLLSGEGGYKGKIFSDKGMDFYLEILTMPWMSHIKLQQF